MPQPKRASAVTCTVPPLAGKVSTTAATPLEFAVTNRDDRESASVVNRMLAPVIVPPEEAGSTLTGKFKVVHPLSFWVAGALSVPGKV